MRGAKKYPVKLANKIGIKKSNPVSVASKMVVLMGVLVTHELIAAIQEITVKDKLICGKTECKTNPNAAPAKNNGMINPPRQPDVTVSMMATIFAKKMSNSNSQV